MRHDLTLDHAHPISLVSQAVEDAKQALTGWSSAPDAILNEGSGMGKQPFNGREIHPKKQGEFLEQAPGILALQIVPRARAKQQELGAKVPNNSTKLENDNALIWRNPRTFLTMPSKHGRVGTVGKERP